MQSKINYTDFKEARYLTGDWFDTFTLGYDDPGTRNWIDEREKKFGPAPGYTKESVKYFINDWRYRDKLVPEMGAAAAFGCSYTFGYGINYSWPSLLNIVNCGQNGASNDQITRLAIAYCKTFKPKEIYVLWSFVGRREHVLPTGGLEKFRNMSYKNFKKEKDVDQWFSSYMMLMNDKLDWYNYQKNKLMLSVFCESNGILLKQKDIPDFPVEIYPLARDNDHPGQEWHANTAEQFNTQ